MVQIERPWNLIRSPHMQDRPRTSIAKGTPKQGFGIAHLTKRNKSRYRV
jgi:hypothetical protein